MSKTEGVKQPKKQRFLVNLIKAGAIMLLLFMAWFICSHFMEYQKNATNQVNKYRIDQLCLLSDGEKLEQHFTAKHTHLKTLKIYSSNDYSGGEVAGTLLLDIVHEETGQSVRSMRKDIKDLANNTYTDFNVNIQLKKGEKYIIRITTRGAESGKEPVFYQWSTREKGFNGKVVYNDEIQKKYLVSKCYYPVTIYKQWAIICMMFGFVILLIIFKIPLPESVLETAGRILFLMAPFITFWLVERFTDNLITKMRPGEFALNVLLYYMFFGLLYLIFVSRRLSVIIGMIFWYAVGVGNYFVLNFKGSPIVPSDIRSSGTAFSVAANYTYAVQPVFIWNLLILLAFLAVIFRCPVKVKTGWKKRLLLLVAILVSSSVLGYFVVEERTLRSVGIKNNVWDQKKGYAKNGFFFGFVLNMNSLVQDKPSGYSAEAAEDLSEHYQELFANEEKEGKGLLETEDGTKPNVIAIMNEAFADLSVVNEFSTNQDYMPYINGMEENTIKGNLYMSIFGSGTCNSEFEFLTGNTIGFLQNGIIAYTQIVKDVLPNITYNLKDQGYGGNLALHPYLASGWNRPDVYNKMGFEKFYSEADFEDPLMYRKYISDQSNMEKIVELYENRESDDDPFYLFNVTMQNHGGFDKVYSNFTNDVLITDNHLSEQANQYLSLIKKTDEAFQYLVEYFEKVDEPTIIVMFGDHQPSVESSFYESLYGKPSGKLTQEELMKKYITPFIIWANYDIEETTIDKMSANYLGAYLMTEAGLETSPYQKFLMKLYKDLPVINAMGAIDSDGNYYESGLTSPYETSVKEYQIFQYNNLIDTKNTVESFFYLPKGDG